MASTSEPNPKRTKIETESDSDSAPYELIYWPGLPGRGEFARVILEEAGVPYTDHAKDPQKVVPMILDLIGTENLGDEHNPPILAPPVLRHGELLIHQTSNIALYLASRHGLAPPTTTADGAINTAVLHLNQIVLTLLDGFVVENHNTHHPIATSLYYDDQKDAAVQSGKIYAKERIPKFLNYAQRLLDAKTSNKDLPWLYGDNLTYADLVLFQCLDGNQYSFPKAMTQARESGKYDGVFKLYDTIKGRPNISKYLASDRRAAYAEGIWRHYPEMEE